MVFFFPLFPYFLIFLGPLVEGEIHEQNIKFLKSLSIDQIKEEQSQIKEIYGEDLIEGFKKLALKRRQQQQKKEGTGEKKKIKERKKALEKGNERTCL